MLRKIFKNYRLVIVIYGFFLLLGFYERPRLWPTFCIYAIYLATFLLIKENEKYSSLNIEIIALFKWFYFYLAFVLFSNYVLYFFAIPKFRSLNFALYTYTDIGLSIFILAIAIFLLLFSFMETHIPVQRIVLLAGIISLGISTVNFFTFILHPSLNSFNPGGQGALYIEKSYYLKLLDVILLVFFWWRYYKRYFVLSEYLSTVIFIFLLSNVLETIHFVAYQHQFKIYLYSQYFTFFLSLVLVFVWARRLQYLQSDVGRENERYLEHYSYLSGLVSKPKSSLIQRLVARISFQWWLLVFGAILAGLLGLFLLRRVNLYVMLNTVVALGTCLLALYFSMSSLRRDWQRRYGIFFKEKVG